MKKFIIIGCPGSGKTTFSLKLSEKTGLPLYHLDAIWHKPDKTHISRDEYDLRIGEILSTEYIIDGNYSRTIERRMAECDCVILFDLPTEVCLQGAIDRIGQQRYDLPWIESELDPDFRQQIEAFREKKLPEILALIEKYKDEKSIVVFHTREQADSFLEHFDCKM